MGLRRNLGFVWLVPLLAVPLASATPQEAEMRSQTSIAEAQPIVTQHQIRVGGQTISYNATTGYMPLKTEDGELKANIFFIAYTRTDAGDASSRPLTFSFNGGPGSSSVWLHLGAIGPKRVLMTDEGEALPPPYDLVDNEGTWLEFSDLVFIDPVETGYSRPAPGEDKGQFLGLTEDVETVGEFIRLYTTQYERWSSPKFLAGESYGTTRASGLAGYLHQRQGMYLNGIVLVSAVLNFQTLRFHPGNDLPFALFLPTYTATAWYHRRLSAELQGQSLEAVVEAARSFSSGDYTYALLKGADLPADERGQIIGRLSQLTGLSEEFIDEADLRISQPQFVNQVIRDQGLRAGRLDSRFTGPRQTDGGESFGGDPSYAAIQGPYTALLNAYVREDLGYENDLPYEILSGRVRPWNWGSAGEGYPYVADDLRNAMEQNPAMRVLVANGYYDLATPFFATEYTFAHLGGDPALRERVQMTYYPSGHMMYIQKSSLVQLQSDVMRFMHEALSQEPAHDGT
jgi:carboxypeptidase C (cathepsin A)